MRERTRRGGSRLAAESWYPPLFQLLAPLHGHMQGRPAEPGLKEPCQSCGGGRRCMSLADRWCRSCSGLSWPRIRTVVFFAPLQQSLCSKLTRRISKDVESYPSFATSLFVMMYQYVPGSMEAPDPRSVVACDSSLATDADQMV